MEVVQFSTSDVVNSLDINLQTFRDWKKKGFTKASLNDDRGRGVKRYFDFWELHCIVLFKMIISQKTISRELASNIVDSIRPYHVQAPNLEYRMRDILVVHIKDNQATSTFYNWTDNADLNSITSKMEYDYIFTFNFKTIKDEVERITSK